MSMLTPGPRKMHAERSALQEVDEEEAAPAPKRGPFGFLEKKAPDVEEEEEEEEEEDVPVPKRQPFSRGSQPRGAAPTPTAPVCASPFPQPWRPVTCLVGGLVETGGSDDHIQCGWSLAVRQDGMGRGRVADAKAAEVEAREAVRRQLQAITREYQSTQAAARAASQAVKCALWASRAYLLLSVWQT